MKFNKTSLILMTPVLLKSSAYMLIGFGGLANALGYSEVGGAMMSVASILGFKEIKDSVSTVSQ